MKVWCCVFLALMVGSLGLPLGDTEIQLLERLIKQLETKQESPKDAAIVTWIETNLETTLKGAVVDGTILESVKTELSRLVNKYIDDNGGNVKDCVYVAATLGISSHIIKDHIKPRTRAALAGLIDSVIFKLPIPLKVHDKVAEKLPEIIKLMTGHETEAMDHIKQAIADKTTLDLSTVEQEFNDAHRDHGGTVDDVVYQLIEQIAGIIASLQGLDSTVCANLPTAVRIAVAEELTHFKATDVDALLNKLKSIDIGPDAPMVFPAIVKVLMGSELAKGVEDFLKDIKAELDRAANGGAGGSPSQALNSLMSIVVEKHLKQMIAHEETKAVLSKLLADPSIGSLDVPLNTLTDVQYLQHVATIIMTELTSNRPASDCMEVKLLAGVAGIVQMDRFLMYRENGEIATLRTNIVSTMDPVINQLGLSPEQRNRMVDRLRSNVDRIVAKMYISKMLPFVKDLESITNVSIAMEFVPLALMEMARELKDATNQEFVSEMLELLARRFSQKITCDATQPVQIGAKLAQFVQSLTVISDTQIEGLLQEIVLGKTCVPDQGTNSKICLSSATGVDLPALVTTVKQRYEKALGIVTAELNALKTATEGAAPAEALTHTRVFAAKYAACVMYEVLKGTPCPSRSALP